MVVLLTSASALGQAQPDSETPSDFDTWLASARDAFGRSCSPVGIHRDGPRTYVACGPAGLWEVQTDGSGEYRLVASHDAGGHVVGLFPDPAGDVWVKVSTHSARPLASVARRPAVGPPVGVLPAVPAPAPATSPPKPPPAEPPQAPTLADVPSEPRPSPSSDPAGVPVGRVVESRPGEVVISLGSAQHIRRGVRIELSEQRREMLGGEEASTPEKIIAIGEVTSVSPNHASVRLGLNERVPVGAIATPTGTRATRSLIAPPRMNDVWELEVMGRPFVALEEFGGGLLLSATFGYRFEGNLRLFGTLAPVGVADVEDRDAVGTAIALAMVSYDAQYLEMGVGLGAQTVNDTNFTLEPGSGIAVGQLARFGARDGLNLTAQSTVVLFHREFEFGSLAITGQIPVTPGYFLVLGGGGGVVGYAYGELGLRALVSGNGGPNSMFVTATAGGAGLFRSEGCRETEFGFECGGSRTYAGPMAGFGVEWRF